MSSSKQLSGEELPSPSSAFLGGTHCKIVHRYMKLEFYRRLMMQSITIGIRHGTKINLT